MEFFVIFIIIVVLVIILGLRHNSRVNDSWRQAANELHLKFEKKSSGLEMKGSRAGFTVVIGTTYRNKARWTEFNLRFNDKLPVDFELNKQHFLSGISKKLLNTRDIEVGDLAFDEKAIISGRDPEKVREFLNRDRRDRLKRVFDRFDGYRVSDGGIKVEEHSLITNPQELVRAAKVLFGTAKSMIDTQATPSPVPPPLPNRRPTPVEAEPVTVKPEVPEEPVPVPSPFEMADNTELVEAPIEVEEESEVPVVVYSPIIISHEVTDFACDILDLFTMNSSHYKVSTAFAKSFLNEKLSSTIIPNRVEKYFLDRTFGRGPGIIMKGEICRLEDGKPITLVIAYPEDENLNALRAAVGKSHAFSGTMVRCDTFSQEIFLVADVA